MQNILFDKSLVTETLTHVMSENIEKVKNFSDFGEKIKFYNENVCSLSNLLNEVHENGLHSSGSIGNLLSGMPPKDIEKYLEERDREINRIKGHIGKEKNYSSKLIFFIHTRVGSTLTNFKHLKIYSTEFTRSLMHGTAGQPSYEIDLYPNTKEEIDSYNAIIWEYVLKALNIGLGSEDLFKTEYSGFRFAKEKVAMTNLITVSKSPIKEIENEIRIIEETFQLSTHVDLKRLSEEGINNKTLQIYGFHAYLEDYKIIPDKIISVEYAALKISAMQVAEYYKWLKDIERDIHSAIKNKKTSEKENIQIKEPDPSNPNSFIATGNQKILEMYEGYLKKEIEEWKKEKGKELCAAFCLFLMEKKIFIQNEQHEAKRFAKARYGINIDRSMKKLCASDNKNLRDSKIDKVKRAALNIVYGRHN